MSPGTISSTARAVREHFHAKATTPETVAQASQLFSAAEAPFTRKNTMFRWNPNIPIHDSLRRIFRARLPSNSKSWCENEAFVRGFLQISRVEEVKTTLSCEASNSTLLNSSPLYSTQLNSTLLCSTLLNSSLPNSSQLYSPANWT